MKKFAAELEASLREFVSTGAAELCENGGRLAPLSKLSREVRGSDDKPLLHIWSEQDNLTRRVIAITDHSQRPTGAGRGTLWPISCGSPRICAHRFRDDGAIFFGCNDMHQELHIHLPLQAADYWLRVRRNLELGEFRNYGYFPGVEIQEARRHWFICLLPRCVFTQ